MVVKEDSFESFLQERAEKLRDLRKKMEETASEICEKGGVKEGDEVIVPALTMSSTGTRCLNFRPVWRIKF